MKFQNGIMEIKLKGKHVEFLQRDWFDLAFKSLGASVSGMPDNYESHIETNKTELFDPEMVEQPCNLPLYWLKVYRKHNEPEMRDCVRLRYRYVHVPFDIVPQYPRVPCKGIFCLDSHKVRFDQITIKDLIHVGNEFQ